MKRLLILLMTLVMAVSIGGCGSKPAKDKAPSDKAPSDNVAGGDSAEPVELTVWVFNDLHSRVFEYGEKAYNEKYPDQPIKVKIETYPNAEMHNKLLISLQSNVGAPDIADLNLNYFSNFTKGDIQLLPLNDIVEDVLPNAVESRFDIYKKDGNYYGIPTHVGATVVYYNKEITDKAGVDIDAIETWDQYVEAGKQVLDKAGVPMTTFEVANQRPFWPMIVQRGGDYIDEDGNVTLDSDINIERLEFMKEMAESGIAIPAPGGATGEEEFWTFMNGGGAASLIMPSWFMSRFTEYMPDLAGNVYIRPMPVVASGDPQSVGIGGTATSITTQCKNPEIAKEFLYLTKLTKEANINIWNTLSFDPVRTDVWDSEELMKPSEYFGNESFFETMKIFGGNIPSPVNGELSAVAQDLVNSTVMYKVFVEKSATPAEALKAAADEMRAMQ